MIDQNSTYKLSNGVEIPCIGFGMWQTMCDLLRDYRDGTLDRDAMYNAWADDPGQSARRDACQDLFF